MSKTHSIVIPANTLKGTRAGIQYLSMLWIPAYAGMTGWWTFYEAVMFCLCKIADA